jgi:signal transduction histidine kinase
VDFSRPVELRLAETDLRQIVSDVLTLASPDFETHAVHMRKNLAAEPVMANVDTDLIKQAVLNIVINGAQAMPEGGSLWVTLSTEAGEAVLSVRDEGTGIPPEIRDKIFNLYFTTKKEGSGIGLAMTYRILQLHSGSIAVQSEVDQGSTFTLRLPITAGAEADFGSNIDGRAGVAGTMERVNPQ